MTKWIESVAPTEPVTELARVVLADRLAMVRKQLECAARADCDGEAMHDLRVATRRGMAALRLFVDQLPARRARWMKRQLRRLREDAGEARDLDVLIERLAESEAESPAITLALEQLRDLRQAAGKPVRRAWRRLKRKHFGRRTDGLIARLHWRHDDQGQSQNGHEPTVADQAAQLLRPAVAKFLQAARADFTVVGSLHRFRIAGKHVRYTMEILFVAFGAEVRDELYPMIEDLQERLGKVNDCATAIEQFERCLDGASAADAFSFRELIAREQALLDAERHDFTAWWTDERAAEITTRLEQLVGLTPAS